MKPPPLDVEVSGPTRIGEPRREMPPEIPPIPGESREQEKPKKQKN